jgi:alkylation response protein AidB-like acyl-CoA dehydrogenase
MDFTFSDDQDALRASVAQLVGDLVAAGAVRAMTEEDAAGAIARDEAWAQMVALGWATMLIPEAQGGLGLGLVDAVVVLEELGRATVPVPFLSSAVLAPIAAGRLGQEDLLKSLVEGSRATVALDELGHDDPVGRVRARASRDGAGWTLQGLKPVVLDGAEADWVIVAARTAEGLRSFLVEEPELDEVPGMDPTRRLARFALDGTRAASIGPIGDHTKIWGRIVDDGNVALAAELVGVCDAALAMATEYADVRVQFDVPLSSHQVIQHKLVDMLHQTEMGRVGVHYAAWASDTDHPDRANAAAIAAAAMAEGAASVSAENIQIHGAVGFTWDSDAHFYFKRAKQNDLLLGAHGWHRRRIAKSLL